MQSIGGAVITADAEGRIEYLNPVAEALTGWASVEAAGRPVAETIHLLGEATRQPIDNPILRCLREGRHGLSPVEFLGNPDVPVRLVGAVPDFSVESTSWRDWRWR